MLRRLGVAAAAIVCHGCGGLSPTATMPPNGTPYADERVLAAVRVDLPVERDGLLQDPSAGVWYEAVFKDDPPRSYRDVYLANLMARGVVLTGEATSPHAIVPTIMGFETLVMRRGRIRHFSVEYCVFEFDDPEGSKRSFYQNAAEPLRVAGRRLTLALGKMTKPWRDHVVVPAEDQLHVKELPLARPSGALLVGQSCHPPREGEVRCKRDYAVRHRSFDAVLEHYQAEFRATGVGDPIRGRDFVEGRFLAGTGPQAASVSGFNVGLVPGRDLTPESLRGRVTWLADYPVDTTFYSVRVTFESWDALRPYLPAGSGVEPPSEARQ